ncbi:hypothetical protein BC835DRAFT_1319231 [Cytidiella melzeri]|nr:hypothetical protein BC835DRAFT_1319231 [Cytidiella melzeri]
MLHASAAVIRLPTSSYSHSGSHCPLRQRSRACHHRRPPPRVVMESVKLRSMTLTLLKASDSWSSSIPPL